jgi:crotonobetainyl-CoA:carnitine CoA-transferase CaiB-like acyl-CoA transferase
MLVPYRIYQARDRVFNLAVGSEPLWARFCPAIGLPEIVADPRFASNPERVRHRAELEEILEAHFAQQDAQYWLERLRAARIPCGPVNTLPDILNDDHFLARGGVVEMDHPAAGRTRTLGNPMHFSDSSPTYRRPAPLLGEHTGEILAELGYETAAVAQLKADGVV